MIDRHRPRQLHDRSLRGAVRGRVRSGNEPELGCHIHDRAAARRPEVGDRRTGSQEDAIGVDCEDPLPVLGWRVCDGAARCDAGAGHSYIQAAEPLGSLIDGRRDLVGRRHLGDEPRVQLDLSQTFTVAVNSSHAGAVSSETSRRGSTDAGSGAGHDDAKPGVDVGHGGVTISGSAVSISIPRAPRQGNRRRAGPPRAP